MRMRKEGAEFKEEGQEYAQVLRMLNDVRQCFDGISACASEAR